MPLDSSTAPETVRYFSQDGHLHVRTSHISKAMICPYRGKEIPRSRDLGLDDNTIYQLLRDPEELRKGAATFNNLQILNKHVPVTAVNPNMERTVGCTGSEAVFNDPYLDNSLAFWDGEAIAGVESGQLRELSAAYHYDADMTPGTYKGEHYDGVMRNIRGNHVCQVEAGRAGNDVLVMDAALDAGDNPQVSKLFTPCSDGCSEGMTYHANKAAEHRDAGNMTVAKPHERAARSYGEALEHFDAGREDEGTAAHQVAAGHAYVANQRELKLPKVEPQVKAPDAVVKAVEGLVKEADLQPEVDVLTKTLAQDSQLERVMKTKKATLSPRAALIQGTVLGRFSPLLAQDQKMPDLFPALIGVTGANWKARRTAVEKDLRARLAALVPKETGTRKLAMDASLESLTGLLDALDGPGGVGRPEDGEVPVANPEDQGLGDPEGTNPVVAKDDDIEMKVRELLTGKLDDADLEMLLKLIRPEDTATDPPEPVDTDPPPPVADPKDKPPAVAKDVMPPQLENKDTDPVLKPAMDAAIQLGAEKAVKEAVKQTTARLNAIREAERFVRPWIGEVALAMDSADEIYKLALEKNEVDVEGVHPSAYRAILAIVPKPGDAPVSTGAKRIAMDAAQSQSFSTRYPAAARMRVV